MVCLYCTGKPISMPAERLATAGLPLFEPQQFALRRFPYEYSRQLILYVVYRAWGDPFFLFLHIFYQVTNAVGGLNQGDRKRFVDLIP